MPRKREPEDLVNENIPKGDIRMIDEKGKNHGIVTLDSALDYAKNVGLDLVVVSGNKKPYTAKVMDYAKYRFDAKKKKDELRKKQQVVQVKEIRLGPTIQENDFQTKLNNARRFLERGDKVKISMLLRGRMIVHAGMGLKVIERFIKELSEISTVDQKPTLDRNFINAMLIPLAKKK